MVKLCPPGSDVITSETSVSRIAFSPSSTAEKRMIQLSPI
jgi:hypothetical protein